MCQSMIFDIILLWIELHDGQLSRVVLKSNIGWDILFGALVLGISRNPALKDELFKMAILGFALTEAIALFALMIVFLLLFAL